jgi:hypothetical protein
MYALLQILFCCCEPVCGSVTGPTFFLVREPSCPSEVRTSGADRFHFYVVYHFPATVQLKYL